MERTGVTLENLKKQRPFFEDVVKQRFIFAKSFEIYGGCKGLYDYGPVGCQLKNNIQQRWREHFILEDDMLEVSCSNLTPYIVLKNSGHVDRFTDLMCKDTETKVAYRADHVLEDYIEEKLQEEGITEELTQELTKLLPQADDLNAEEMGAVFKKYGIMSKDGNPLSNPAPFNLMFATQIGPWGDNPAYLRPETAQSLITNFKKLLAFNSNKLPFAAATIGMGFRNEIAPRNSLLRVREFEMGEIEHFLDPLNKDHIKFDLIKDVSVPLFKAQDQLDNKEPIVCTLQEALDNKILFNQTIAYFIAKTYQFMELIGLDVQNGLRFRQHKANEKAHYAEDCWDCELLTSMGWVECVGIADRSAYDLTAHSNGIGKPINAERRLAEPKKVERIKIILNKGPLGKSFKAEARNIFGHVESLDDEGKANFKTVIESGEPYTFTVEGKEYTLTQEHVKQFKVSTVNVVVEKYTPSIIEPSFGFGRIIYALLEQSFYMRDEKRTMFKFKPFISPIKCSILPLMSKDKLLAFVADLDKGLKKAGVSTRIDTSGQAIGKRYARTDEIGIPFAITIDFDTVEKNLVTLREGLSMKQVQVPLDKVIPLIRDLVQEIVSWDSVVADYPAYETSEAQE